jgi:pimeloyl-ACP methyl ester carboxylesterase
MGGGMHNVVGSLAGIIVGLWALFPNPATAAEPTALPLHECRIEHPLHLNSLSARCGSLSVPLDREHPDSGSIDLNVAVVPALNRRSEAAPLFLLAGGPGQGAVQTYVSVAGAFARINRNHAIVLLDQRGTGKSSQLSCAFPEVWQQQTDPLPAVRKATAECLAKLGPRVRFYTTSIAVQDLEAVRAALGFAQIDLYGGSYGTRVAEQYMRRYPDRAHAVILDGVLYPEQLIGPDIPRDAEHALGLIVARCQHAAECNAAYPDLTQDLSVLLRQFGTHQTTITIDDPNSGAPRQIDFNHNFLAAGLRLLSYSSMGAALLPTLIHQGARSVLDDPHGTLAPLAAQTIMTTRQVNDLLANGMQYSVICSEDVPLYAAANIDRTALEHTYMGAELVDAFQEICRVWPKGPVDADLHSALHSDVPTLLLSGEADPVTPPAAAEHVARGLTRQRHLVLSGEGHGQLATSCVPRLMAAFLDTADPDKLDSSCLEKHSAEPFFVSTAGPAP